VVDGLTVAFTATGTFSDNSKQDLTTQVSWSCTGDGSIATISNAPGSQGKARGEGVGTVTILATLGTLGGIAGMTDLEVTTALPDHLVIVPTAPTIAIGTTGALVAKRVYTNQVEEVVTDLAKWTSATTTIATVGDAPNLKGQVTAGVTAGTSVITAAVGTLSASTTLTVAALSALVVAPATRSIAVGASTSLTATGTFLDSTTTQDLTSQAVWTPLPLGVATVSAGTVTGVAAGSTMINAAIAGKSGTCSVTVTQ
jgi:hypothetical protein